ncbi:uncharacterized protein LOC131210480 [Anopheles bellator]|uniref:uncharacterized protein LOC131210480 n=1 Tax=Anopheles bellator TaxID=139047 RepID=UPI002648B038|nr:uncharacterized protein LOC131210480 [Anopheles bellator]
MAPHRTSLIGTLMLLLPLCSAVHAQTVADCVQRIPESARATVCDIRYYRPAQGPDAESFLKCALAAVGFVAQDGSVQRNVVLAALDAVETHDGVYTDSVDVCLSRTRKLSGDERPRAFFSCMLATESAQNFKDALELRELKTNSEWPESGAFETGKVQQLMQEVNRKLKC